MDYTYRILITKRAYVIILMRALRTHTGVGHTDSIQHNIFDSEKLKFFVVILTGFLVLLLCQTSRSAL